MKTKIPNHYPALIKYDIREMFNPPEVPEKMIELIKEYIPLHTCIGTIWNKERVVEMKQTEQLRSKCAQLKKKILAFDFYGTITVNVNGFPIVLNFSCDNDEDLYKMTITETSIITLNFEFDD